MQSTRQRILDYLRQHGNASASQLAQAFGMTPANLRRHLGILQKSGLVAPIRKQPAEGRGRPELVYILAASALPNNLQKLASTLLDETKGKKQEAKMQRLAAGMLGNERPPEGHITKRLVAAVQRLEPLGYRPRWEARPDAPQVVLGLCPYAAIIAEHPELCLMDAYLLEKLSGAAVEQLSKLQPSPQGTPQCVFQLKSN